MIFFESQELLNLSNEHFFVLMTSKILVMDNFYFDVFGLIDIEYSFFTNILQTH